jgi:hypothetical protein
MDAGVAAARGLDLEALTSHDVRGPTQPSRAKWLLIGAVGMVLTFGVGLWFGRTTVESGNGTPVGASSSPREDAAAPEPIADSATPPEVGSAAPDPPEPEPDPSASDDIAGHRSTLTVQSNVEGAYVYLDGESLGAVGVGHDVSCGVHFVRLGNHPLTRWLGEGRAIDAPCGQAVEMALHASAPTTAWPPKPAGAPTPKPPPALPQPKGWTPDDL